MSAVLPLRSPTRPAWLLSDTQGSALQSRLGWWYLAWQPFAIDRLAMIGLAIVRGLLLIAALAVARASAVRGPLPPS